MPRGDGSVPDRSRSPHRGARRGHRAGAYVRSTGQLPRPQTDWSVKDRADASAGVVVPEWFRRLRAQLGSLPDSEKVLAAGRLRDLAAALDVESGVAA